MAPVDSSGKTQTGNDAHCTSGTFHFPATHTHFSTVLRARATKVRTLDRSSVFTCALASAEEYPCDANQWRSRSPLPSYKCGEPKLSGFPRSPLSRGDDTADMEPIQRTMYMAEKGSK